MTEELEKEGVGGGRGEEAMKKGKGKEWATEEKIKGNKNGGRKGEGQDQEGEGGRMEKGGGREAKGERG